MTCCTGMPSREVRIRAIDASASAPIQTNNAIKRRKGSENKPMNPKIKALPCVRRHLGGAGVFHARGQKCPQHAPAVHRKGRQNVKTYQPQVDHHELFKEVSSGPAKVSPMRVEARGHENRE